MAADPYQAQTARAAREMIAGTHWAALNGTGTKSNVLEIHGSDCADLKKNAKAARIFACTPDGSDLEKFKVEVLDVIDQDRDYDDWVFKILPCAH